MTIFTDEQLIEKLSEGIDSWMVIEPEDRGDILTTVKALLSVSGQASQSEKAVRDAAICDAVNEASLEANIFIGTESDSRRREGAATVADRMLSAIRALASTPAQQTEAPVNVPSGVKLSDLDDFRLSIKGLKYMDIDPVEHKDVHNKAIDECLWMLENFVKHLAAAPAPVQTEAQQSEKDQQLCNACGGHGTIATGIAEASSTLCNTCDGTGIAKEQANQKGGA